MAEENENGAERTEEASAKRLSEARERGDVPRSRELGTMLLLLASAGVLWATSSRFLNAIQELMRRDFQVERALHLDAVELQQLLDESMLAAFSAMGPFLLVSVLMSIAGGIALGGWTFSAEAFMPQWQRIDPMSGLGRIFSTHTAIELGKATLKFLLLTGIGAAFLWQHATVLSGLSELPLETAIHAVASLSFQAFLTVIGGTVVIALIDVPFQRWEYAKKLRMTKQELREEARESDGSPEMKGKIRNMQQELARRRMMEQVPKADVVVTNPEHYAVALRFDPEKMSAPRVIAKGADELALRIREIAREAGVSVLETPPLARAIYHTTKLNHEIPAGLYIAVAQVLAYVFQLKRRVAGSPMPKLPRDLPIPPEMQF